jgi:hypothetical protein
MHREALRAGAPLSVGAVTLLPIERVVRFDGSGNRRTWFSIAKEPFALVVRDAQGMQAIDIDSGCGAVSLERLREMVADLDTALAAM